MHFQKPWSLILWPPTALRPPTCSDTWFYILIEDWMWIIKLSISFSITRTRQLFNLNSSGDSILLMWVKFHNVKVSALQRHLPQDFTSRKAPNFSCYECWSPSQENRHDQVSLWWACHKITLKLHCEIRSHLEFPHGITLRKRKKIEQL